MATVMEIRQKIDSMGKLGFGSAIDEIASYPSMSEALSDNTCGHL